jgi:hypothetical protein
LTKALYELPQKLPSVEGINWKAVVIWSLILGGLAYAVYHFRDPLISLVTKPPDLTPWVQQLTLDNILAFITKYGILISGACTGIGIIYGLYKNYQTNKAIQELSATKQAASTQVNAANTATQEAQDQAKYYKDLYETEKNKPITLDSELEGRYQDEIKGLKGQITALSGKANMGESEMASYLRSKGYEVKKIQLVE